MDWSQRPIGTFRTLIFLGVVVVLLAIQGLLSEPGPQSAPARRTTLITSTDEAWPGCADPEAVMNGTEQSLCLARADRVSRNG